MTTKTVALEYHKIFLRHYRETRDLYCSQDPKTKIWKNAPFHVEIPCIMQEYGDMVLPPPPTLEQEFKKRESFKMYNLLFKSI